MSIILMEGVIGHMERAADRFVPGSAPTGYETAFASVEGQDNVRDLYLLYGGIGKTFTTLFRAVTGADWSPFAAAMSSIGWAWGLLWSFYIFVVMLGTFNIVNGLFIDIFMKPLPGDHAQELAAEELLHRRLCKLLVAEMKALGKNPAEDPIGRRTFRAMLKRERLSNKLIELGISLDAEREPFHIIDTEGHGELTPAEVATQILDVRGGARGIDLARVVRQVTCMRQDMATLVATLLETTALRPDAREEGAPIKTAVIEPGVDRAQRALPLGGRAESPGARRNRTAPPAFSGLARRDGLRDLMRMRSICSLRSSCATAAQRRQAGRRRGQHPGASPPPPPGDWV
eukprot:CAMPEP_0176212004 /NCGR_PEP_ID=MMETSP0121_2-20121125/14937_1 /TAXON_ID=160619 /ORGANISM="Kryptoperidinium foliaceum, Strain CCMP 1326" /LENGTH=344 /DNA_ID=CAMNT_0017551057 /DNA_START=33 /DNA_END=1068 /DNA_ORIENTATION=+